MWSHPVCLHTRMKLMNVGYMSQSSDRERLIYIGHARIVCCSQHFHEQARTHPHNSENGVFLLSSACLLIKAENKS